MTHSAEVAAMGYSELRTNTIAEMPSADKAGRRFHRRLIAGALTLSIAINVVVVLAVAYGGYNFGVPTKSNMIRAGLAAIENGEITWSDLRDAGIDTTVLLNKFGSRLNILTGGWTVPKTITALLDGRVVEYARKGSNLIQKALDTNLFVVTSQYSGLYKPTVTLHHVKAILDNVIDMYTTEDLERGEKNDGGASLFLEGLLDFLDVQLDSEHYYDLADACVEVCDDIRKMNFDIDDKPWHFRWLSAAGRTHDVHHLAKEIGSKCSDVAASRPQEGDGDGDGSLRRGRNELNDNIYSIVARTAQSWLKYDYSRLLHRLVMLSKSMADAFNAKFNRRTNKSPGVAHDLGLLFAKLEQEWSFHEGKIDESDLLELPIVGNPIWFAYNQTDLTEWNEAGRACMDTIAKLRSVDWSGTFEIPQKHHQDPLIRTWDDSKVIFDAVDGVDGVAKYCSAVWKARSADHELEQSTAA